MIEITAFLAGALLCNALPHLAAGLRGEAFPTPFARPRGRGLSSALVNFLWGMANAVAGLALLALHPIAIAFAPGFLAALLGALAIGTPLSLHFARVRRVAAPKP